MAKGSPEPWHARAPFWIGLALTALGGFVTVKVQIAANEVRFEERTREVENIHRRLTALESRCP